MSPQVVWHGPLTLIKDTHWQVPVNQNLILCDQTTTSSEYHIFNVIYEMKSIIPLYTVKLYTLASHAFKGSTQSQPLLDYLSMIYQPVNCFQQPKYALLLTMTRNDKNVDPFSQIQYPLASTVHLLLYAQRTTDNTLQTFASVIRDRLDYTGLDAPCLSFHQPSTLEKHLRRCQQLKALQDQRRRDRPERTLIYTKRRIVPKKAPSSSSLLPPISRQTSSSSLPPSSSSSNLFDTNKKNLKTILWSRLRQLDYDSKHDDTKLYYHTIYQSIQYILRNTFKTEMVSHDVLEQFIERHLTFYAACEEHTQQLGSDQ
ncbi:hypothetical protein DM01DRAFT_1339747 [Hesseltinella vesiculosa]|uniref:Sld7 C-terminal domain-containing protein n=1 Tax=Hesseltinella vesiculosa TaxID=101127 RepID=A0A1X2G678_9FUNG|nr:hypothetical protein DM01DRAFT_1339747 [Hesseltinella vesiculosa]